MTIYQALFMQSQKKQVLDYCRKIQSSLSAGQTDDARALTKALAEWVSHYTTYEDVENEIDE